MSDAVNVSPARWLVAGRLVTAQPAAVTVEPNAENWIIADASGALVATTTRPGPDVPIVAHVLTGTRWRRWLKRAGRWLARLTSREAPITRAGGPRR